MACFIFIFIIQILVHNRTKEILSEWPISEATVVLTYIKEVNRPRKFYEEYVPTVYYEYAVDGEIYSQQCGPYGDSMKTRFFYNPEKAENKLPRLGSKQIIYYRPGYPMECYNDVSIITDGEHIFFLLLIGCGIIVLLLLCIKNFGLLGG